MEMPLIIDAEQRLCSPHSFSLEKDFEAEIKLWTYSFKVGTNVVHTSYSMLSRDERDRADRIQKTMVRDRFVIVRAGLRQLLARYLDTEPNEVAFAYGDHGKPYLNTSNLSFNVSHSGNMAAYVVSCGRKVGVDVEFVGRKVSHEQIARRFFAREETAALQAEPEEKRSRVFFGIWTLKEAYLKARGTGISIPLDSFAVGLGGQSEKLLREDGDPEASARWKLVSVDIYADYVAAVCGEGQDWQVGCYKWPEP